MLSVATLLETVPSLYRTRTVNLTETVWYAAPSAHAYDMSIQSSAIPPPLTRLAGV